MSSATLISDYIAGLHRRLPAAIADEAADGLLETYERHLAAGAGEQAAARAAIAEFGDLGLVADEFTRQAPGRRTARTLLATRPGFGAALLLTILALVIAATSRRSYRRTIITAAASPAILILDATAVAGVLIVAPLLTPALVIAATASLTRITFTARTLARAATR